MPRLTSIDVSLGLMERASKIVEIFLFSGTLQNC